MSCARVSPRESPVRLPPGAVSAQARRQDPARSTSFGTCTSRGTRSRSPRWRATQDEARRGARGSPQHCARAHRRGDSDDSVAWPRMVAWLPTTRPSSFGYFYSGALARQHRRGAAHAAATTWCSSTARRSRRMSADAPAPVEDPRLRRHGFAEVARVFAAPRLSRCRPATGSRRSSSSAPSGTLSQQVRPVHLHDAGRDGSLRAARRQRARRTGFRTASTRTSSSRPSRHYDRDLIAFVGRMDYFPNQQAVHGFCRGRVCRGCKRAGPARVSRSSGPILRARSASSASFPGVA